MRFLIDKKRPACYIGRENNFLSYNFMENCNAKKSAVSREEAQAVLDKIGSVIVREVGCKEKEVVLDARWRDDLGADSLDMAYVMMEIDKLLEIHIDENDGWEKNSTLYETCSGIFRTLRETDRR